MDLELEDKLLIRDIEWLEEYLTDTFATVETEVKWKQIIQRLKDRLIKCQKKLEIYQNPPILS